MSEPKTIERCSECDEPTGNAGAGEDSLFLPDGRGPMCWECYEFHSEGEITF